MGNSSPRAAKPIGQFYTIEQKLGSGAFATVKACTRKRDKKRFAVKIIKKHKLNHEELKVVHEEVKIMEAVQHPNVVQQIEIFESKKTLYLVMEILEGGELFDRIVEAGSFSEQDASKITHDIAAALNYLHKQGVVHRDLKPENLIYSNHGPDSIVKITDFGLAKFRDPTVASRMNTACGTPSYVAPEVLKEQPYGPEVDLWSLGVIVYIMLSGYPPFYHEKTKELYKLIKKGKFDFNEKFWGKVSKEAKDLICGLLTVDPTKRFTPQDVLDHPWITGTASSQTLGQTQRLRLLQAKKKLKMGVHTIIAINKFVKMFHAVSEEEEMGGSRPARQASVAF